jgi:hypothetical protein
MRFDYGSQVLLPEGYEIGDNIDEQSGIVLVAANAGIGAVAEQTIVALAAPVSAKVYIRQVQIQVIDAAAFDQLYFALKRNGGKILPYNQISGTQIEKQPIIPIDKSFDGGDIWITAINISGTTDSSWPNPSPDAIPIRCIARIQGYLLRRRSQ